jgi:hypothetical protein
MPAPSLKYLLSQLNVAEHVPRPDGEEWKAMIDRISLPGMIADIDGETFFYFLEVLPPKYQSGSFFAFAEGAEPLRLFWRSNEQYFCRQLAWDETKQFCRLAGVVFPYWD